MARPQRNNVDYFPFLCEDGKKMFYLEETYGNDGFATFVKLLRELAKANYHYLDLSKNTTTMFLSAKCKVSKEVLDSIINDLVELEKFDEVLWNENRIIWCQDFTDSVEDAYSKRINNCITYEGLLLLLVSLGVRKPSKPQSTGGEKPQSKVDDTKEDNNIIEGRKQSFLLSMKEFESIYSKDMLNEFYLYWTEHGEKDKKMRFEKEKSFALNLRLIRWDKNNKKRTNERTQQNNSRGARSTQIGRQNYD